MDIYPNLSIPVLESFAITPSEEKVLGTVCLSSPLCLDISGVFCLYHLVPETGGIVPVINTEKSLPVPVRHCLRKQEKEEKEF